VAVNESSGDVYVVDRENNRVEEFGPKGEFILTWGWGVQDGLKKLEVCTSGCEAGLPGVGNGQLQSPAEIAVDNSSGPSAGDVYVVADPSAEQAVLQKFGRSGELMGRLKEEGTLKPSESGALDGVAVDSSGTVWVYRGESGIEGSEAGKVEKFSNGAVNKFIEPVLEIQPPFEASALCPRPGFAVDATGENFYADHERETLFEECPAGVEGEKQRSVVNGKFKSSGKALEPLIAALDPENTTATAVELPTGTVYLANETSVAAFSSSGSLIQRFGSERLKHASGVAVNAKSGEVYVADSAAEKVDVYEPEAEGKPAIESSSAQAISATATRLSAKISPDGAETSYVFQYSTAPISGTGSCAPSCSEVPQPPGELKAGIVQQEVSVEVKGLAPNTTYHYRLLAQNKNGSAESPQSSETFFTTLPTAESVLLDHRSWELVSPPEKHGALIEPISREGALIQASSDGNSISWAASAPVAGESEGNRQPEPVQVISTRGSEEWSSKGITTPHNRGEGIEPGEATEYRFFTPDLSLALVQPQIPSEPLENPPLVPEASEKTIYRRNDATGQYEPLVTANDVTAASKFGGKLEFAGATSDLKHIVFESEVPLIMGAVNAGLYEWESGAALKLVSVLPGPEQTPAAEPTLGDQGRDVRGAISSDGSRVFWTNGLGSGSDEGPLYMRDTVKGETIQVNAAQGVGEPSEEERGEGLDQVHFQAASSDGSRVLFTDTWPLTKESNLEPRSSEEVVEGQSAGRPVDLYEFDLETGKLIDLTLTGRSGEHADVLGTLPGISEDGSYVYFIANGVLAPGAEPGNCPRTNPLDRSHPEAACNLYASEPDPEHPGQRETRLIARLSAEDAADWGGGNSPLPGDLGGVTSQVSANGRYLAFMSQHELTGYHNVDSNPEAKGAHDEEVFLYDASAGRLVCASCDPSGEPPHGVFDTEAAGEGLGLTVDRPETWRGHWLAGSIPGWTLFGLSNPVAEYQSRYLSNSGRLLFNSADALVPQVTTPTREEVVNGKPQSVGVENVYEYEPSGEGSCNSESGCVALVSSGSSPHESAFLDASESGNDVFFLTAAKLVAQDTDNSLDVYDARVCGTAQTLPCLPEKPPPPPPCTGEGCRPPISPQQSFQPPASSTFSEPGSLAKLQVSPSKTTAKPKPLTRAQKLAKALKACRKLKHKHKRAACEAKARKTYRAKPAAKKKTAKKTSRARKGS